MTRDAAPRLILTVDTELSNFPRAQGLWANVGGESWGLVRLIDTFDALDVRGTFFLDVYVDAADDVAEVARAARLIVDRGHDLQLHTHPGPSFDRARDQLRHYSLEEQQQIIDFGVRRLEEWSGQRPLLHRAGDWAADERSLVALASRGFLADFSASPWSGNCSLPRELVSGNGWQRSGDMLCAVGTCYKDRLTGRVRRVDLGGTSFREALDILALGIDPLILTLHSFSMMRYDRTRTRFAPFPEYVDALNRFCRIARQQSGYRTVTALEAARELRDAPVAELPWKALPTTQTLSSCAGILKSVGSRIHSWAGAGGMK